MLRFATFRRGVTGAIRLFVTLLIIRGVWRLVFGKDGVLRLRGDNSDVAYSTSATPENDNDFKTIILLMVSLLHGSLFIILCDQTLTLIRFPRTVSVAALVMNYAIFLRVFQTHLLAAIKYDSRWKIRPFDFVYVFVTALFEYLLFMHPEASAPDSEFRWAMVVGFSVLGYSDTQ